MTLRAKQTIIAILGVIFLLSLVFVQWVEVNRKQEEAGLSVHRVAVPMKSRPVLHATRPVWIIHLQ